MTRFLWLIFTSLLLLGPGCQTANPMTSYLPTNPKIEWHGRYNRYSPDEYNLIGSASSLKFRFKGDKCIIWLSSLVAPQQEYGHHVSWVLDDVHYKMTPINSRESAPFEIPVPTNKEFHDLEIFKESETSCGFVRIGKIEVEELLVLPIQAKKKIEFIGNSITAGMSADPSIIPCGEGGPCDQHNAYESYGATVARTLNMDFVITAVSGIGVYRNFSANFPVMSDVYENTLLTAHELDTKWDFTSFIPDIVCINLGTNDFSDGGGLVTRDAFDSTQFINKYIALLEIINKHYPLAKIVLLQHDMSGTHNVDVFSKCLLSVKQTFQKIKPGLQIEIFAFSPSTATGCLGHPGLDEHKRMAEELSEFLRR
ncbi:MAG TPA: GDSL-type esterase/lipase family protein [Saprospiraceae bacterium]|nr:GDSL-type esterase/lipase family protein [Saprospiraceae bacterium]